MSTTDAFLPFDDRDDRDEAPDEYEDELDVEEGLARDDEDDLDDEDDEDLDDEDDEDPDFSDTETSYRAPTPGARLTADELESDLDEA